jgi:hypothetical protein
VVRGLPVLELTLGQIFDAHDERAQALRGEFLQRKSNFKDWDVGNYTVSANAYGGIVDTLDCFEMEGNISNIKSDTILSSGINLHKSLIPPKIDV